MLPAFEFTWLKPGADETRGAFKKRDSHAAGRPKNRSSPRLTFGGNKA